MIVGKVNRARTKKKWNREKIVPPRPDRVLQRRPTVEGPANVAVLVVSICLNALSLLIRFTVSIALWSLFPTLFNFVSFQFELRFASDFESDVVREWRVCYIIVAVFHPFVARWFR